MISAPLLSTPGKLNAQAQSRRYDDPSGTLGGRRPLLQRHCMRGRERDRRRGYGEDSFLPPNFGPAAGAAKPPEVGSERFAFLASVFGELLPCLETC